MKWSLDNPVMRGLGRIADFIILNLLWMLCSIPIFTIGASTTALYTVMMKIVKNEEGYIAKGFFEAFKENFKQSTIMWLIIMALSVLMLLDIRVSSVMNSEILQMLRIPFIIILVFLVAFSIYAFALQARFINTVKNTMKNALILTFAKLPYTILILIITIGTVLLTFVDTRTMVLGFMLWFFIGVSVVTWLNSLLLRRVFSVFEEQ